MAKINCDYGSVRFPIKELLEEIYAKAGEKLKLGVHVRTTVKLDKIQEFRKLALEQAKACVGKQKSRANKNDIYSSVKYQSDKDYNLLNEYWGTDIQQEFVCSEKEDNEFFIYLRYRGLSKNYYLTHVTTGISIRYNFISHDLRLHVEYDYYGRAEDLTHKETIEMILKLLRRVYDPEGKGYRFVTPFLVDKTPKILYFRGGLTSKLIPNSFQPPPLSMLSTFKLSEDNKRKFAREIDMAEFQAQKRLKSTIVEAGYLFTQIQ